MHERRILSPTLPWPPDDTEESVLGSHLHQETITNARMGIREAAQALAGPDGVLPFQAGGQTLISGMQRRDGSPYKVFPDVFVYPRPFDIHRQSMSLDADGPPTLAIEVLSEHTWRADLDFTAGKGRIYAEMGIAEYLVLDPATDFIPEQARGWRLVGTRYVPWLPDTPGRWRSVLGIAFGFEGIWLVVYDAQGRPVPRLGQILRGMDQQRHEGLLEGETIGRTVDGWRGGADGR